MYHLYVQSSTDNDVVVVKISVNGISSDLNCMYGWSVWGPAVDGRYNVGKGEKQMESVVRKN
jgi:hypothetical protein